MGHIARCVILANHLVKYYNVFFIIDKNKKKFFKIKNKVKIIYKSLKKNISVQKKYFLDKKLMLNFKYYDLILSDNLIEPIFKNNKTMLLGNFFWHDIKKNQKIKNRFLKEIKIKKIKLLRNYLFAYNIYKSSSPTPFFGKFNKKYKASRENILISLGTAQMKRKDAIINSILSAIEKINHPTIYLDKDIYKKLLLKSNKNNNLKKRIAIAKYDQKMFDSISIAIIKPGLGIVRDCLSNSIKMVIPTIRYDEEFSFNSKILYNNNLGILTQTFAEGLDYSINFIKDSKQKINYFNICKNLKWNGEEIVRKEVKQFFLKY
jgi:hypothetical protein